MEVKQAKRRRTITWDDPVAAIRNPAMISGKDYLLAIKAGHVAPPPVARLVGYKVVEVEDGSTTFELEPDEYHYNPFATVHGGILATLLDTTMTASVLSKLSINEICSTAEIKVNFLRPIIQKTGLITCKAKVLHIGKVLATAEGKIFDQKKRLYAHAVCTCSVFRTL